MAGRKSPPHPDSDAFFEALGLRVKELRKDRGWSLHKMVADFGYYDAQWRKYEKGGAITVDGILKMCTIFGVTLTELIGSLGQFPRPAPSPRPRKKKAAPAKTTAA